MAFVLADFKTGDSSGNGPSIHSYTTPDTVATVNTEGYFNSASEILSVGDFIFLQTSTGGTAVAVITHVLTNAAGVVDIADGTVLAATDTD